MPPEPPEDVAVPEDLPQTGDDFASVWRGLLISVAVMLWLVMSRRNGREKL
jgi:hypothetical protein